MTGSDVAANVSGQEDRWLQETRHANITRGEAECLELSAASGLEAGPQVFLVHPPVLDKLELFSSDVW